MAGTLENTMLENQEVVTGDYLGEEYFDEDKPEYDWDTKDNLIVGLKFPDQKQATIAFQKFISKNQDYAKDTQIKTNKYIDWETSHAKLEISELDNTDTEIIPDFSTLNIEAVEEPYVEEEPLQKFRRIIWKQGLVLDYPVEIEANKIIILPVEIRCDVEPNLVLIKVGSEEILREKRKALSEILNSLGGPSEVERFAVCNCQLCQKSEDNAPGTAYRIPYQRIENLKERYVPRIQCYGSGKRQRLDEISILDRPKIKVAIIHESQNDNDFCKNVKEWFSKQDIDARVWDKNDLLAGDEVEQKIKQEIHESDVLIALISPHLFADEKTIDVMLEPSVKRAKKENALLLGLVVRETVSWQDLSPFNLLDSSIVTLSEEPISSLEPNKIDKVWKTSGEKLHAEIDRWLNKTHRFKLKK